MNVRDVIETAFVTHLELFCYSGTPFGLKSAPAMFQRAVIVILASVEGQFSAMYINITIIFPGSLEKHLAHTEEVLRLLMDAGMKLKLEKCYFLCRFIY